MTFRHIIAAACLAAPSIAFAQTQPAAAPSLSLATIEQRLAADGFRVVEIERYPGLRRGEGLRSRRPVH